MSLLRDEQGHWSSARSLAWIVTFYIMWLIPEDAGSEAFDVAGPAWVLLGTMWTGLMLWAAPPRVAQYLAPQFGAAMNAISGAVGKIAKRRNHDEGYEEAK